MRPATGSIDAIEFLPIDDEVDASPPRVGDVIVIRGWAHQPGGTPAFSLLVDGTAEHPIVSGMSRPDVAASLDDPRAVESGFTASFATYDLADGDHTVAILASDGGARQEIALAHFRLSAAIPLANLDKGRGWIDSWTDEEGRIEPIVGASARVPRDQVIRIDGWVADTVSQAPAVAAFVLVGDHVVQVVYGFERPDVANELGEHHAYCGFSAAFPGSYVSSDGTLVRLVLLAADGNTLRAGEPTITMIGY